MLSLIILGNVAIKAASYYKVFLVYPDGCCPLIPEKLSYKEIVCNTLEFLKVIQKRPGK